jgi:TRAP-type C4-dicarboxylate transport system permease small subunit
METLFKITGNLSWGLASLAKLLLGLMVVIVVADVCVRNLGMRPLAWGISASEYSLLYAAFLPMPWLVRTKGHVFVEFLRAALSPAAKKILEKTVYTACIAISLYIELARLFADRLRLLSLGG